MFFAVALLFLMGSSTPSAAVDEPFAVDSGSAPATLPSLEAGTTTSVQIEPFVSPLGAAKKGRIVSGFGKRMVPNTEGKTEFHEGVDYRVNPGASIRATRAGKVLFAGFSTAYASRKEKTEKHRLVIVRHSDGMSSRYVHLNSLLVRPMQEIKAGTPIGTASASDEWKEPVLHFEIRDAAGKALDPEELLTHVPAP